MVVSISVRRHSSCVRRPSAADLGARTGSVPDVVDLG